MMQRMFGWICTVIIVLGMAGMAWGQSNPGSSVAAKEEQAARHAAAVPISEMSAEEVAAMKADLQKMRVLLNQMRTNLGFVQNTTTPLNHQFQLEIEMWQVLMNQMERRMEQAENRRSAKPE